MDKGRGKIYKKGKKKKEYDSKAGKGRKGWENGMSKETESEECKRVHILEGQLEEDWRASRCQAHANYTTHVN